MNDSEFLALLEARLLDSAKEILIRLIDCWHEMYDMDEGKTNTFIEKFVQHTNDLYKEMLDSQLKKADELRNTINNLLEEKATLEKDLNMNIMILHDNEAVTPLSRKKDYLEKLLEPYMEIKKERISEMNELSENLNYMRTKLGREVSKFIVKNVPTEEDLMRMKLAANYYNDEMSSRINTLQEIKDEMLTIIDELEITHDSVVEYWELETKFFFMNKEEDWSLSTDYVQEMQFNLSEMRSMLSNAKTQKGKLICELKLLWNRIREDIQHQNNFLAENNCYGKLTLKRIHDEIERCKIIRKQKLKPCTDYVRAEIMELWDKLTFINEKREHFKEFHSDEYSERLLSVHEFYLSRLQDYYTKYKELYRLMNERNKLWLLWVELETRALDKNRFNNRGGQLLKEEKERKLLSRKIPTLEKNILASVQDHLDREGKPFLWHGQELKEIIECDHQKLEIIKEKQKSTKKEEPEKGPGSAKRKLHSTPVSKLKKIPKKTVTLSHPTRVLNQTVTLSSNGGFSRVFSSPAVPTPTSLPKDQNEPMNQPCEISTSMSPYKEFQAKLISDTPRRPFEDVNQETGPLCSSSIDTHSSPSKTFVKTINLKPWSKHSTPSKQFTLSPRPK